MGYNINRTESIRYWVRKMLYWACWFYSVTTSFRMYVIIIIIDWACRVCLCLHIWFPIKVTFVGFFLTILFNIIEVSVTVNPQLYFKWKLHSNKLAICVGRFLVNWRYLEGASWCTVIKFYISMPIHRCSGKPLTFILTANLSSFRFLKNR